MIRSVKKLFTGFKENPKFTVSKERGNYIIVQKEKKVEETYITRQKRNFTEFESKLGTERGTDLWKIAGAGRTAVEPNKSWIKNYYEKENFDKIIYYVNQY